MKEAVRRDSVFVFAGLILVIIVCWTYLLRGAGTLQEMDGMLMPMSSGPWTPQDALAMFIMWVVMMAAMMLPSATPAILLYGSIVRGRRARGERAASPGLFALGYFAVWVLFSVVAVALQFVLERVALLSSMMELTSVGLAGAILLVAGAYQWTSLKETCLSRCRSPLDFFLAWWREGVSGAFLMGARHGVYCVGCCWSLMLLLFVGGIMNLAWIAGLAAFVAVEKLAPAGHWAGKAAGVGLMLWGAATLATLVRI